MRNSRPIDPSKQVRRLEQKHAKLEKQVEELDGQVYLTATEERQMRQLKKKKLATKDELETLRRSVGS